MNKYLVRLCCSGALILGLNACRSTQNMLAEPQVEMPEVAGRTLDAGARVALIPARGITTARGPAQRPPNMDLRTEDTEQAILTVGVDAGLGDRFEVGLSGGAGTSGAGCAGVTAKYQAYGESRAVATKGDLAVGLAGHAVGCRAEFDGDSANYFEPGGSPWSDESTSTTIDLGASIGYRLADLFAVYGGMAFGLTRAESIVNQDASTRGLGPGGVYSSHVSGVGQSYALGGHWGGHRTFLDFKINYARNNSDYINPSYLWFGTKLGVNF